MIGGDVYYSSKTDDWFTPQPFFDQLDAEFGFTLDPCASRENAKCLKYFTVEDNGLNQDWSNHIVYMNPPYGRSIGDWIDKAIASAESGSTVVCLIPAKTETRWWAKFWDYETHQPKEGCQVRFVFKRIQFGNSGINAPFPCAVVIFRPR
jgi:phage N-6-adenine-methyltransferase